VTGVRPLWISLVVAFGLALASLLLATPPAFWSSSFFAAAAVAFLATVGSTRLRSLAVGLGLAAGVVYEVHWQVPGQWLNASFNGVGAVSSVMALEYATRGGADVRHRRWVGLCVLLFPIYLYVALGALSLLSTLAPPTYDGVLTLVDRSLGGDASFAVGRWLAGRPTIRAAAYLAYQAAPIAIVGTAVVYRFKRPDRGYDVLLSIALTGLLGFALYTIVPAAGPVFRWESAFPSHPPADISAARLAVGGYSNAIPSVHAACAVIVLAALWPLGFRERVLGLVFAALTVLSTLGFGEHYLVDLIVGAPFGTAMWLIATRPANWGRWTLTCGSTSLGWLIILRLSPDILLTRGVCWFASVATIAVSVAAIVSALAGPEGASSPSDGYRRLSDAESFESS
jgi:hypothetical protein